VANAAGLLLTQFAQYFVPARKAPDNGADVEKMLVRVAALLDAFSTSFVALRKGYNQFGSEMALPHHRNPADVTPLDSAADAREVIAYLLDWTADGNARVQELTSAYADIMIHQVALLNGLMEGVRSLLHRLGPTEIDREVASSPLKLGPISLPRILWPFRGGARWRRFVKRHRELTEEDREITSAVFGAEFARAYAGVVGENFTERGPKQLNDTNRR
jgi:predicted component of type VI protein secretion system